MARYQVALVQSPAGWQPASPDDVPPECGGLQEVLGETEDFFAAVRRAVEHNEAMPGGGGPRWAVVVEPGSRGRTWREARLCTPVAYKVIALWWPAGWEPQSPLDVPRCVSKAEGQTDHQRLTYRQAVAAVHGLNRQGMNHPGTTWYAVVAVENEPLSQTVSCDPAGTETVVEVRRLHVVRPEEGGRGDCSHCPAQGLDCAESEGTSLERTIRTVAAG